MSRIPGASPEMKPDLEIAQSAPLKPIQDTAASMGLEEEELELYGKYKAKISLDVLKRLENRSHGKYIDVTCITPTPLGEGKTVTTIGLSMALNRLGKTAVATLRQPSMGPTFGIKGGAAGGGYSQVIPMEDFNLHLTGDNHAVSVANNLLAAFIDNHIHHGNALGIESHTISWKRVVDISDRALRNIVIGLGRRTDGPIRQAGVDIAVASEVMAILALTTSLADLRQRLGRIVVAESYKGKLITAEDLKCAGAMAVLLKDAIKPTLMQTIENTPCLVHTGPFANIAHGNSSILADLIGRKCADYVITESGFGVDMGCEKFINIKCRSSGLTPDAVVLVCTVRALKMHSGAFKIVPGKPFDPRLQEENLFLLVKGIPNLEKQIENVLMYGVPVVVAINRFDSDSDAEIEVIREAATNAGAEEAVVSEVWARGGEGGTELAHAVMKAADKPKQFRFLYELDASIMEKIETIATKMYGAEEIEYLPLAKRQIRFYKDHGFGNLPICMAKTHLSLSHDPKIKGRPTGFSIPIREVRAAIGAGFLYALLGDIMTMPGLPSVPGGTRIDIDENGKIIGLS